MKNYYIKLFIILVIITLASCTADCDAERDSIHANYIQALQNAHSPAAIEEIERQYHEKLSNIDC